MNKKKILLDLRNLSNPASGFGQIALNYAKHFGSLQLNDLQFVFLVPESYVADASCHAEIVNYTREMHHDHQKLPTVDIWHSVNQQQKVCRLCPNTKFVLTIHDLNYLTEKNWLRQLKHNYVLGKRIRKADIVTAISGYVGKQVEAHFKKSLGSRPVEVVYDAVEHIADKPQLQPAFADGTPFFFTLGQIRMKKNFHLLLDVMKSFPRHQLYICGDDHFEAGSLIRKRLLHEGIENVHLTGKITEEEKVWLYAHCDAFLFPSQGEGFGLPVIEAMQFGKPVFVSSFTCLPEISSGHAFVWKNLSTATMVDDIRVHLKEFYSDSIRMDAVRRHARSFSYSQHVQKYVELYRKLL